MGSIFAQLKNYLRQRGLSINYAASLFNVNYSTMRSLLAGNVTVLRDDLRAMLEEKVSSYLSVQREAEDHLYQRLFPIISDVPTHVSRAVLKTLAKDVDAL